MHENSQADARLDSSHLSVQKSKTPSNAMDVPGGLKNEVCMPAMVPLSRERHPGVGTSAEGVHQKDYK